MSILIKGVETPKSCAECPMGSVLYGYKCLAKNKQFSRYAFTSMQDWCPLIEIPDKHGRLIDADALRDNNCDAFEINGADGTILAMDVSIIDDAPTIIPAEPCNDLAKPNIEADCPPSIPLEQVWTEVFGEGGE